MRRGYFGIGIMHTKTEQNIGTLYRSAAIFGADFIYTVGKRYSQQCSDTAKAHKHIPLYHFATLDDLKAHLPMGCRLVGVELDSRAYALNRFSHPDRACYLLGAEDYGLTKEEREACHALVQLPGEFSLNVAVAGSIVMYDRITKGQALLTEVLS
jgi:tRNA G18 (ribose-2'-O)-methylase SpoU